LLRIKIKTRQNKEKHIYYGISFVLQYPNVYRLYNVVILEMLQFLKIIVHFPLSIVHFYCDEGTINWNLRDNKEDMAMYEYRFPEGFLIGTANSAFQSEGAWGRDGASASMMEHFAKVYAGKPMPNNKKNVIITTDLADKGCFFYDNYEAYIDDMVKTGQNTFRMSLAWWRIIPTGYGEVNQKAIDHYNRVIDKLLEKGIEPFVDLNHWDVPQCLRRGRRLAESQVPGVV